MTLLGIAWKEWLTWKEDSYNILNLKKKKKKKTFTHHEPLYRLPLDQN